MELDYYKNLSIDELIKHRDNCQKQIDNTSDKLKEYSDDCFSNMKSLNPDVLDAYREECISLITNQYQILNSLCNKLIDERNNCYLDNTPIH